MENMWKTLKKGGKEIGKEEISSQDFFNSPKHFFKKVDTKRNDKSRYKKGFLKKHWKRSKEIEDLQKRYKKNTERQ